MRKIAYSYLPEKDALKKMLDDSSSKYPEQFSSPHTIYSDDGVPIAKFLSINEDYDSHLKFYAAQHLRLTQGGRYLPFTMDELRKRFTKEKIIKYFQESAIFESKDNGYFRQAISAYWDLNYLVSSHFFIPLIETGIWRFVMICGGLNLVWKRNKSNGFDHRSLSALLNDERVEKFFNKDILFYFKLALTERLGFNLRNDFAHGLEKGKFHQRHTSDRLFHILILLSLAHEKDK